MAEKPIRPVTQNHGMGCAVACVASVLRMSYQKALALFEKPENAWTVGYFCPEIVAALEKGGMEYSFKAVLNSHDPVLKTPGTIVFTEISKAYPFGHYLLKTKKGWMNPWINCPEIAPAKSALVPKLPAKPTYAIFSIKPKLSLV